MNAGVVRQAAVISLIFWAVAVAVALVVTAVGSETFGDYLMFVSLILLGIMLVVSAPLANWVTGIDSRVWAGTGNYRAEDRAEQPGGLTAFGLLLVLVPQVALVSLLFT